MRASIVIATYNDGEALTKTVQTCVETCSGLDYEIIVADDASWDGSVEEVEKRFPRLRVVRNPERLGPSPTKDRGARAASGEVLIFLDGHAKPERGALRRLIEDVEHLNGRAVVTPTVVSLDVSRWRNAAALLGHGYRVDFETFRSTWLPLSGLRTVQEGPRTFYETPAAIGCALAVTRELYETLWGFDPDMRSWGVEDVDFSLKCWLMGYPILHDPEPVVGHRFQRSFNGYSVPQGQLVANQLRMARKNFTHTAWEAWVAQGRQRYAEALPEHPEGLWAHAWQVFESRRPSVEEERAYLLARRTRDEFWYADRFGLTWPRLHAPTEAAASGASPAFTRAVAAPAMFAGTGMFTPSPTPPPPPPPPPPHCPCEDDSPCCCQDQSLCCCTNGNAGSASCVGQTSEEPVRYSDGEVQLAITDLEVGGYGKLWQHRRVYSNQLAYSGDLGNGYNWLVEQWPYLIQNSDGSITMVRGTTKSLWFDLIDGVYVGRYGAKSTLTHDTTQHTFVLVMPTGEQWTFQDFDQTVHPEGLFKSQQTAGGQTTSVTAYTAGGHIGEIQRSTTLNGTTTTESFLYTYTEDDQAQSLMLRRQVNGGSWTEIRQVVYEYYNGSESFGSLGDLKRARIQVPQGSTWADSAIHYYRYYTSGEANGFVHGLKYVVKPSTYATMVADGFDPLSVTDGVMAQYADQYLQYDGERRVTLESLSGGSRTYSFSFTPSGNSEDYNHWAMKTVEIRPDSSQNIVYTNHIGQILLKELRSGTDSWITYYQFDSQAHQTLAANPSAVQGYDDASPDLGVTLNTNGGLIYLTDYYNATGSGAAQGYVWRQKLQQGSAGTPVVLRSYTYTSRSAGGATIYPVAQQTVYRNNDGTGAIVTSYSYSWYSGTTQMQQKTTTLPAVSTSQNGSGVAAATHNYYDTSGKQTWHMDERGFITAFQYDITTGALTERIDDVDTSQTSGAPSGWTTPAGGGLNLVSDFEHDDLGRITQELGPWHTIDLNGTATSIRRATWTVYQDLTYEQWVGQGYATGTAPSYTLVNPVAITKRDAAGKVLEQIQATRSTTSGRLEPTDSFAQSSYIRWTTFQYTDCCLTASLRVYHTIPSSGMGSPGTNYDETDYGYDTMKRRNRTVSPGGTITDLVYDVRGQVVATYVGTDDIGAAETDPTGSSATGNNMVVVTERQYDNGLAGGDGNLTQETQYVDATTSRVTTYLYDWRNRRTDTDGEVDFYQKVTYDNLDRVIQTDRYDTTASGHLIARSATRYDDRGRVYQTVIYGVDPSTGTIGNALTGNIWFDAAGNTIKSLPAGSQLFTKTVFDSLDRPRTRYMGYGNDASYADVQSVANNTILEQAETFYDNASNSIQATHRQRYHDALSSQAGPLGDPSTTPKARVTYVADWPDALGRTVATASYGTNGGAALARPDTVPARSDTILVTTTGYNDRGEPFQVVDPASREDQTVFDDAGRRIKTIENYVDGAPTTGGADEDRTTTWTYTPDGAVATMTAVNPATGDQTTSYVYGTTLADSNIATSTLQRSEVYPDSTGGSDQVAFAYNRQQEVTSHTDQNGTVHSFDYDLLGRHTQDRVTTLGTGVDGAVRRIATVYEVRGMAQLITSYDDATVGQGNVVNQVQFAYNDFGQFTDDYQAHAGTVDVSTTPKVQYGYADGSANTIRPTSLTYPDGRVLTYDYGTAGGMDDNTSRIASFIDNNVTTHLADYSYLGQSTFVEVDHPQPQVQFTLIDLSGANDPDTGDIYTGFDRFGRIKDNRWYNSGTSSDVDRIKYGYDRANNRLWRQNTVAEALSKGFDELYSYDGLYRLVDMQRGTLSANRDAITGKTFAQDWALDATGNWSGFDQDDDGDGTWDLVQSRAANTVNEITDISENAGPSWVTPAYSPVGNMTALPQPTDPTTSYTATYDAWDRLVAIIAGSDTVSEYAYDGARRRTVQKSYTNGTLNEERHLYYTRPSQWQVLEERIGTSANPERQFAWGLRYIDDCVLRDRDTNNDSILDERLYVCQDANWNVTALTDDAGDIQERDASAAYGAPQFLTPLFGSRATSSFDWETLYCGYRYETATGLYHVRNRVYLPMVGVWLVRDLAGYADGINLYVYASCMPIVVVDPTGNWTLKTVQDFFNWYYTGGGLPVDLPTMAPGVFAAWLKEITPELDGFKSSKMKDILGGAVDCDKPNQTISGNSSISVSAGGGLTNVLTVMGNSIVRVNYSCQVTVECETCCDDKKAVKHVTALCKYNFNLRDRFANPLDWNGQTYERDEKAWAKCVVDCMSKNVYMDPRLSLAMCKGTCDAKYPPSEFAFATPYDITAIWSDFSRQSWDYKGCPQKP